MKATTTPDMIMTDTTTVIMPTGRQISERTLSGGERYANAVRGQPDRKFGCPHLHLFGETIDYVATISCVI